MASIDYTEDREIRALAIENSNRHIVYMYSTQESGELSKSRGMKSVETGAGVPEKRPEKTGLGVRQMNALQKEMDRTGGSPADGSWPVPDSGCGTNDPEDV